MVKHLVMWNFKEDFPEEQKEAVAKEADARLKALVGQIKGLTFAEMKLNKLPGSNRELLLVSDVDNAEIWQPIRYIRCMWPWPLKSSSR